MADLKLVTIPPPYNGMNSVAAPGKCPEGQGPLVRNFLTHIPGKLPMRGPLTQTPYKSVDTNSILAAPNILTGAWSFNSKILLGFASKSATAVVPPWVAPYYLPTSESELSKSSTTAASIDISAGSATKVTLSSLKQAPTGRGARIEKYVYGFGYGWTEKMTTANGAVEGVRPFLKWDGTNAGPTEYVNAPFSGQDVKSYLNRIFVLGGRLTEKWTTTSKTITGLATSDLLTFRTATDYERLKIGDTVKNANITGGEATVVSISSGWPAESATRYIKINKTVEKSFEGSVEIVSNKFEPNTLLWSVQGGPIVDEEESWKDEVSGLTNRIIVGDDDQNDFGVALAVVNQTLLIFKRHSIWALYGSSPSTFQVRNLTTERGCIDPNSVYEDDGTVYFFSQHGFEQFNGSEFNLVDEPIANITRPIAQYHAGEKGLHTATTDYGRIKVSYAGNDYLFLSIAGQGPNTGTLTGESWAGYMHTKTGNWAEFSTSAWSSQGVPLYVDNTGSVPWAWDGRQINPMTFLTDPWSADSAGNAQVDVNLATTKSAIPAKYWSDRVPLSSPGYTTQFHRFLFDYRFPNGGSDSGATNGWYVTLFKSKSSEEAIPETQVPGQAQLSSTSYLNGRRWEKDVFDEATDCRVQVEWKSSTLDVKLAEVYDTSIELSVARQRRST